MVTPCAVIHHQPQSRLRLLKTVVNFFRNLGIHMRSITASPLCLWAIITMLTLPPCLSDPCSVYVPLSPECTGTAHLAAGDVWLFAFRRGLRRAVQRAGLPLAVRHGDGTVYLRRRRTISGGGITGQSGNADRNGGGHPADKLAPYFLRPVINQPYAQPGLAPPVSDFWPDR